MKSYLEQKNIYPRSYIDLSHDAYTNYDTCPEDSNNVDLQETILNNPFLDSILSILPNVTWILDIHYRKYYFISSNIKRLLGYSAQQFIKGGLKFTESLIHHDDIQNYTYQKHLEMDSILNSPFSECDQFQNTISFRIKNIDGVYIPIIEQNLLLIVSTLPDIPYLLGTYASIHDCKNCNLSDHSSSSTASNTSPYPSVTNECPQAVLSKRELEIVKLISKGYSSKQIAQQLNISFHTVNTHRQKMIEKTHTKNTGGLIQFAAYNKLI